MDDESGWNEVLVDGWGPLVLAAVVERVERTMVGRRGVLVRALVEGSAPNHAACVEEVHARILEAIRTETGADLDALGSQAAWASYDQVWGRLQHTWGTGVHGGLVPVPAPVVEEVVALVRSLSPAGGSRAGADVGVLPFEPLAAAGWPCVDVEGLFAHLACDPEVGAEEANLVHRIVGLVRRGQP